MEMLRAAEILAVGTELTTGVTRDTNSGDLAAELTGHGVRVLSSCALPDDLDAVRASFEDALSRADLVVSTGGLGPTPDDLTREAIAAACGLELRVDPEQEAWLRGLFFARNQAMPAANLKQAWLVDGAVALPNGHGSAPGWWLERPDGRVTVALPGPPREWRPMWQQHVVPRLEAGRLGVTRVVRTLRLSGIGESALVDLVGEDILRARQPQVGTYARADAVDLVISAESEDRSFAQAQVDRLVDALRPRIEPYLFAEGDAGWPEALAIRLGDRTLAVAEVETAGTVQALLGAAPFLLSGRLIRGPGGAVDVRFLAAEARAMGADIGMAVLASEASVDTHVSVAIATEHGVTQEEALAFQVGEEGRRRAAIHAARLLWQYLGNQ